MSELMRAADIARLMCITPPAIHARVQQRTFPTPAGWRNGVRVWQRADVIAYLKAEKARAEAGPVWDHGTEAGYRRHYKTRIPYCGPCRKAHAAYNRELAAKNRAERLRQEECAGLIEHGSDEGIKHHKQRQIPVCDACLDYVIHLEQDAAARYLKSLRRSAAA